MARIGGAEKAVLDHGAKDFDGHHAAVRAYFAKAPERRLEFDVDRMPVSELVAFAAPDIRLRAEHWHQMPSQDIRVGRSVQAEIAAE